MVVVQAVLIFWSETWVMTPWLDKSLEGFHHCTVRRMACMGPKRQQDRTRVSTPVGAVLSTVRLEETGVYIARRQNKVAQYIATHTIMEFCLAVEWNPGLRLSRRWWEQPSLDILGIRVVHAATEVLTVFGGGS